jgi:hypothetical protein
LELWHLPGTVGVCEGGDAPKDELELAEREPPEHPHSLHTGRQLIVAIFLSLTS